MELSRLAKAKWEYGKQWSFGQVGFNDRLGWCAKLLQAQLGFEMAGCELSNDVTGKGGAGRPPAHAFGVFTEIRAD